MSLILASSSPTRARLLRAAGVAFEQRAAAIDEEAIRASLAAEAVATVDAAVVLAELKGQRVAASAPADAIVLAADQLLDLDGTWLVKPVDRADARDQLLDLRGRRHRLASAVVAFRDGSRVWHHVATADLWLREFTDAFLDNYLERAGDAVIGSVGAYQLEGLGAQLMARIEGDHSTVLGLPLLPTLQFLRDQGLLRLMIVLGLTGSIAMGKSRAAAAFRSRGVPVFDADGAVHALLAPRGAAVAAVAAAFPGCADDGGGIDRRALGAVVLGNPSALACLELLLHPLVRAAEHRFLGRARRERVPAVVLDIPLLLEGRARRRVDRVAVVSANRVLQRQRALTRPEMTAERLAAVLAKQMPDAQKRRRADYIIPSGADRGLIIAAVDAILTELRPRAGTSESRKERP